MPHPSCEFASLLFLTALSHSTATVKVNLERPEANGPFLVYEVPNFRGADQTTEYAGFYILLPIDNRFGEMDDQTSWYSGKVVSSNQILFQMPAWPFALWPFGAHSRIVYDQITSQVGDEAHKSMNSAHHAFDKKDGTDAALLESRKWKYVLLDFSGIPNVNELSSKVLYTDAGEQEMLDYDFISCPAEWTTDPTTGSNNIIREEELLGFKVASIDTHGGRKVLRTAQKKSKLAQKKEEAAMRKQAGRNMQQG